MKKAKAKYEIYRDVAGEWRGRLRTTNGRLVLASGEGYKRKGDVRKIAEKYISEDVEIVMIGI